MDIGIFGAGQKASRQKISNCGNLPTPLLRTGRANSNNRPLKIGRVRPLIRLFGAPCCAGRAGDLAVDRGVNFSMMRRGLKNVLFVFWRPMNAAAHKDSF